MAFSSAQLDSQLVAEVDDEDVLMLQSLTVDLSSKISLSIK
jgi:hypothetical protein